VQDTASPREDDQLDPALSSTDRRRRHQRRRWIRKQFL